MRFLKQFEVYYILFMQNMEKIFFFLVLIFDLNDDNIILEIFEDKDFNEKTIELVKKEKVKVDYWFKNVFQKIFQNIFFDIYYLYIYLVLLFLIKGFEKNLDKFIFLLYIVVIECILNIFLIFY